MIAHTTKELVERRHWRNQLWPRGESLEMEDIAASKGYFTRQALIIRAGDDRIAAIEDVWASLDSKDFY